MTTTCIGRIVAVGLILGLASTAHAQTSDRRWTVDFGIGWDNSISGNINSSTIGSANGQTLVVLTNKYEEVYGTGLHFRVGGGYKLNPSTEARVTLSIQALDADLATLGDYGASPLYADFTDYESTSLDFGLRRYGRVDTNLRPYAEGTIGIGFINGIDAELVAPQANLRLAANNFYQDTSAFTWAVQGGLLGTITDRVGGFVQIGIRYVSGLADVDNFVGTGLDEINDNSSRWTLPFLIGVQVEF
jgi:hypothetical protein